MSRRKQQNPKPLVALKQAEDDADKHGCRGIVKLEPPDEADAAEVDIGTHARISSHMESSQRLADDNVIAADTKQERGSDIDDCALSPTSATSERLLGIADILKVTRTEGGECKVSSRVSIAPGQGCGPFKAQLILVTEKILPSSQFILGEADEPVKFTFDGNEYHFAMETNEGHWMRHLSRPQPGQDNANVKVHFVDGWLWIEVTRPLSPDTELVAELSIEPQFQAGAKRASVVDSASLSPEARPMSSDVGHNGEGQHESTAVRVRAMTASALDMSGRSGSALPAASFTCPACGVAFRSPHTLAAHEKFYCSKIVSPTKSSAVIAPVTTTSSPIDVKQKPEALHMSLPSSTAGATETNEKPQSEAFQCQICKYVTCEWAEMCSHMHDHKPSPPAQGGVLPSAATRGGSTVSMVTSPASVAARGGNEASYCTSCNIQFMSMENYDVHRQHYCGSRRARTSFGHVTAASTTQPGSPVALLQYTTPRLPQRRHVKRYQADDSTGNSLDSMECDGIVPSRGVAGSDGSVAITLRLGEVWTPDAARTVATKSDVSVRSVDPRNRPSATAAAMLADNVTTISIPAVLSVAAALTPGSGCKNGCTMPGKLTLTTPPGSGSEGNASVTVSVPSSIGQRAMAATSQRQDDQCHDGCSAAELVSPAPRAHHDGPLDLSVKYPKRKPDTPITDDERRPPKAAKVHARMSQASSGKPTAAMSGAAALLIKCTGCSVLFYKHENYVAHKTHYCPSRRKDNATALHDNSEVQDGVCIDKSTSVGVDVPRDQTLAAPALGSPKPSGIRGTDDSGSGRDASGDEAADDRLVITYTCNKCGKAFVSLPLFRSHACSSSEGESASVAVCSQCGDAAHSERPCGDHPEPHARRSGSGVSSSGSYICNLCGYHGNTIRGMRLHGRYHLDRGEPWSELCITESCIRGHGISSPISRSAQGSPNAEDELLRMKNEPYKKRKSRKYYEQRDNARASPRYFLDGTVALPKSTFASPCGVASSMSPAAHASDSTPSNSNVTGEPLPALNGAIGRNASEASPVFPLKPVNGSVALTDAGDGNIEAKSLVVKVKTEPSDDPDAAGHGNNENHQAGAVQKRHVCSHCNIGFMYASSYEAHSKFYCASSRPNASVVN